MAYDQLIVNFRTNKTSFFTMYEDNNGVDQKRRLTASPAPRSDLKLGDRTTQQNKSPTN